MNTLKEKFEEFIKPAIEKELTTQKKEIVEMIDGMENTYKPLGGSNDVQYYSEGVERGYNQAKEDIKSKILNK